MSRASQPLAVLLVLAGIASAQLPYQNEILNWKAQDALDPPPADAVVFVGSSSVRLWEQLSRDFAHYDVIQRGFGGSQFSDLNLWVDELILDYDPAAVVVFEGTNDVAAGKTATTVFNDYLTFVDLVHTGQSQSRPPIPILYIGITPTPARWTLWPIASSVNAMVEAQAALDPSLFYMDIPTPFLATGMPPSSSLFLSDGLHLNQSGYDIWTSVIRPDLESAVPPTKVYQANGLHPPVGERLLFDFGSNDGVNGLQTPAPDMNGNHWNNWFTINGGQVIYAGEHIGNLITSATGDATGIGLVITGECSNNGLQNGGLAMPQPSLLGRLAVGTATADYFFGDDQFLGSGFHLKGLDPALAYDVRFFATRNDPETRITRFRLVGRDVVSDDLQTSGVGIASNGSNGNDDTILSFERVRSDRFGQLFVDVEKIAGSFSYLGILELVVRRPLLQEAPALVPRGS